MPVARKQSAARNGDGPFDGGSCAGTGVLSIQSNKMRDVRGRAVSRVQQWLGRGGGLPRGAHDGAREETAASTFREGGISVNEGSSANGGGKSPGRRSFCGTDCTWFNPLFPPH